MNKLLRTIAMLLVVSTLCVSVFAACKKGNTTSGSDDSDKYSEDGGKTSESVEPTAIRLAENGRTEYKIIIPEKASDPEKFAAEELKNIFFNSTGADIAVDYESSSYGENDKIISIGNTAVSKRLGVDISGIDFNYDGYLLKRVGNVLVINAKEESGKINGVYGFAERNLGYRYYAQNCVKYGDLQTVSLLDFDLVDVPDFQGRISFSAEVIGDGLHRLRMKNNNQGTDWLNKYGNSGFWSSLSDQSIPMEIVNATEYYSEHKDWYHVNSERTEEAENLLVPANKEFSYQGEVWTLIKEAVQMCYHTALASKGVEGGLYETFLNNLIHGYIEKETNKRFFMLGMADNEEICDCDGCTADNEKYTVTGTCMRFVNSIARDVEAWRKANCPDREIDLVVFAYLTTQNAPVKKNGNNESVPADESVVAENNVVVRIAPIYACHYYSFDDAEHNNAESANLFANWQLCAKRFAIWDYKMSFDYKIVPFPTWNSAQKNLRAYKKMGVVDVLTQGNASTYNTSLGKMDDYIRSRLMWDTSLSYQTLADEFMENYYGEASEYMKEYLAYLEMHYASFIAKQNNFSAEIYKSLLLTSYWPKETLINIENIFKKAYAAIEDLPDSRRNVLKDRIDCESAFYRFAMIELYGNDVYTTEQLIAAIEEYKNISSVTISLPYKNKTTSEFILEWKNKYNLD